MEVKGGGRKKGMNEFMALSSELVLCEDNTNAMDIEISISECSLFLTNNDNEVKKKDLFMIQNRTQIH